MSTTNKSKLLNENKKETNWGMKKTSGTLRLRLILFIFNFVNVHIYNQIT